MATEVGSARAADAPATVGEVVGRYLREQHAAIMRGDASLRADEAIAVDSAVHVTRVAIRRYRSVLREVRVFVTERATAVDAELAWLAGLLGEVRDRQVLRRRLCRALHVLPSGVAVGAELDRRLGAEQERATGELGRAMAGRRYAELLGELRAWNTAPPYTDAADRCAVEIAGDVDHARRRLRKRLERAVRGGDDELLHRARKAAKRARYVAELAEPALGRPARKLAKRAKAVQTELGRHQDSVVAAAFLRGYADGESGFGCGILWAGERDRAQSSRAAIRRHLKRF
ncbi:MAG: CHAD domain-containing protein [Mycobacteriales bacterium]|nr:MAG: hypothetical protein DLM56_02585 [Pseudonocardiales bacterium]